MEQLPITSGRDLNERYPDLQYREGSKMDPVMADRRVIVALSDAFGGFQNYWIPPTPSANAGWGLPCHFKRSGGDKWAHYTNPEYGCHREFSLKLAWFWRWEPLRQWSLGNSIQGNRAWVAAMVDANPLNPAHPMAFPLETAFAEEGFKGDGKFRD